MSITSPPIRDRLISAMIRSGTSSFIRLYPSCPPHTVSADLYSCPSFRSSFSRFSLYAASFTTVTIFIRSLLPDHIRAKIRQRQDSPPPPNRDVVHLSIFHIFPLSVNHCCKHPADVYCKRPKITHHTVQGNICHISICEIILS